MLVSRYSLYIFIEREPHAIHLAVAANPMKFVCSVSFFSFISGEARSETDRQAAGRRQAGRRVKRFVALSIGRRVWLDVPVHFVTCVGLLC